MDAATREAMVNHHHTKYDGSWWEFDGRGIPLCRVCEDCREAKLSRFNPRILGDYNESDLDAGERLEEEE